MFGHFIETDMPKREGDQSEKITFNAIKAAFKNRECYAYLHFPIFLDNFFSRREPDILLLDKELGVTVIEVKGIKINNIISVKGHEWTYKNFYTNKGNPYEQAENQLFSLMDNIKKRSKIHNKLTTRVIVALPFVTKAEWVSRGLIELKSCPHILFKDDLEDIGSLVDKISNFYLYKQNMDLKENEWEELLELINGEKTIEEKRLEEKNPKYSFLYIASTEEKLLNEEKLIREYLKRGVKVILLCPFKKKDTWFAHKDYEKFRESRFFQYIPSEVPYNRCLSSKLSHLGLNLFQTDFLGIDKFLNFSFTHRVKAYVIWQRPVSNVA